MIADLQKKVAEKIRSWAKARSLSLPQELPLSLAPAHVKADLSLVSPLQIAKMNQKKLDGLGQGNRRNSRGV